MTPKVFGVTRHNTYKIEIMSSVRFGWLAPLPGDSEARQLDRRP